MTKRKGPISKKPKSGEIQQAISEHQSPGAGGGGGLSQEVGAEHPPGDGNLAWTGKKRRADIAGV
jgi:hypothetical protein